MLQNADTIGVFQVESRAQMATLPRLKPACFYDLVVEVAIIRPGPIVGQMVHPYLNRRAGREPVRYPHPSLEPILARTLGVPLFQEQLLRIAMVAAGFTGGQAEDLRRAFGFKRSERRMAQIEVQLREGMARRGITGEAADQIIKSITSFALYGFPESHAASFALLAYASAYLKAHYPAAFYTALLNNQPMGFYHPATLVKDAQRHGLKVRPIDAAQSGWPCTLETAAGEPCLRLGLSYVKGLRARAGEALAAERARGPFADIDELARRVPELRKDELRRLAEIGALNSLGAGDRRDALWQVERAARRAGPLLDKLPEAAVVSPLARMTDDERLVADYRGTELTIGRHPLAFRRAELDRRRVVRAVDLGSLPAGRAVRVAGQVICRQRPGTAKGFLFLSLEDETGVANAIVTPQLFERYRAVLVGEPYLLVEGRLQNQDGVVSVKVQRVRALAGAEVGAGSHDFH